MSEVQIICPNLKCRSVLRVSEEARGKTVRCKRCQTRIQVPAKPAAKNPTPAVTE